MRAMAIIIGPDGARTELEHGDLVGRLRAAALWVDDPRVSEAHAMVSLRREDLKLLGLRGRILVGGVPTPEVVLRPGLTVELAPGLALTVEEVALPDELLGLEGDGLVRQALHGVTSLFVRPRPRLEAGYATDADAVLWGEEATWRARLRDGTTRYLAVGDTLAIGGRAFTAVAIPLSHASVTTTLGASPPLHLTVSLETAQIQQGDATVHLAGLPAQLLSELVAFGGPVSWEVVAGELWAGEVERDSLRRRFDMALSRLRRRLRDAGVRSSLIVMTGTGQVELVLRPGDVVDDRM